MITKRSEAKELIAEHAKKLDILIGKPARLTWDKHDFEIVVEGIDIAKTTGRKNVPDKRDADGKNKSPMLFVINTNAGELLFTLDDAIVTAIHQGVRILIPQDNPIVEAQQIEVDIKLL